MRGEALERAGGPLRIVFCVRFRTDCDLWWVYIDRNFLVSEAVNQLAQVLDEPKRWPGGVVMASPANPKPNQQTKPHPPYCADPNCESCADLRQAYELLRFGKAIPTRKSG